jgi:periplasmic copper chaperone A
MTWASGTSLLVLAMTLACRPDRGGGADVGDISIRHAVVPAPPSPSEASVFLSIDNLGLGADTLTSARSPEADSVLLHEMVGGRMQVAAVLAIAPGGPVRLAPGSYHLMLHGLTRRLVAGDTVTLELRFARAGPATVRAPVLRYTEAVEAVSSPHH